MERAIMTVNEVLAAKRSRGIPCTYYEERDALLKGERPYGTAFPGKGRMVVRVYRIQFERWLDEMAPRGDASCG